MKSKLDQMIKKKTALGIKISVLCYREIRRFRIVIEGVWRSHWWIHKQIWHRTSLNKGVLKWLAPFNCSWVNASASQRGSAIVAIFLLKGFRNSFKTVTNLLSNYFLRACFWNKFQAFSKLTSPFEPAIKETFSSRFIKLTTWNERIIMQIIWLYEIK